MAQDQYVALDFLNINPADPAIEGFVFDQKTQGISGVVVELYQKQTGRLVASTTTSASGWYVFRFTQPGTYVVKVVLPTGYTADNTSVTLSINQFETLRVDFVLRKA